jgi:hypothetical protein
VATPVGASKEDAAVHEGESENAISAAAAGDDAAEHGRIAGRAHALFAFDIGFQIDLDEAGRLLGEDTRKRVVRARRAAPVWFDYSPPPLRMVLNGSAIGVGDRRTSPEVEMLIYDFGAALLTYTLPLPERIDDLPALSAALYEHAGLEADARAHAARILGAIRPAVERPEVDEAVEDYAVFAVTEWGGLPASQVVDRHRDVLARAIEAEDERLAEAYTDRVLGAAMSYTPNDLVIVDWNAAVLFDAEPDDVIAVLQHANVELLELRVLDQELDAILDHADETLARLVKRRLWPSFREGRLLRRFASVQTDAAVMFEGVNNAIKLLGNQYLARLYRLGAERMDVPSWNASVQRKLEVTESLYQKMSDAAGTRRLETLEWVIIILIAVSIVLPFTPLY